MGICNICAGSDFNPGPNGRLSRHKLPPQCARCGSYERHRVSRFIFEKIGVPCFGELTCLQFSKDPSVERSWFKSHHWSVYGVENSLDITGIDLPDQSYDIVICNHVLEHVKNYHAAIHELVRITSMRGFLWLTFPYPVGRSVTEDWGYPKPEQHGHYREFGRDIEQVYRTIVPNVHVLAIQALDPVTGDPDLGYLLTRSERRRDEVVERVGNARVCQSPQNSSPDSRPLRAMEG